MAVWTVRTLPSGDELVVVPQRTMADLANDFSSDGRLLALGTDRGHVEVWDLEARAVLFRWQPQGGKVVHGLAFGPNGEIATTSDDDDRLSVLRLPEIRERLAAMGLGW